MISVRVILYLIVNCVFVQSSEYECLFSEEIHKRRASWKLKERFDFGLVLLQFLTIRPFQESSQYPILHPPLQRAAQTDPHHEHQVIMMINDNDGDNDNEHQRPELRVPRRGRGE